MTKQKKITFQLLLLALISGVIASDDLFGMRLTTESFQKAESPQYRFRYFVKDDTTGDYKVQEETKEGDLVHGSYTLAEPNGDLRTVTYKVGPGKGFEAKVDVQTSGSPMKQITKKTPVPGATAAAEILNKTDKLVTDESRVKHFTEGFKTGVYNKPQPKIKKKMEMKFSLKASSVTSPTTVSDKTNTVFESEITRRPESTPEIKRTTYSRLSSDNVESSEVQNSTFLMQDTEINEDQIKKEIDDAMNFMPKLPELILSDNKTRFKFYKDPEEALLDERITQIAKQLAETSLRREYEERKIGHFIPISLSSVEPSTSSYLSKSFKYTKNILPSFKPFEPSTLHVLTQLKMVPQYIYKHTLIPRLSPINYRLPASQITKPWELQTPKTITNPPNILKINKFENRMKQINQTSQEAEKKIVDAQPVSIMPFKVPTPLEFFSPYVMHSPKGYITPESQLYTNTAKKKLTMGEAPLNDDTVYAHVTMIND